MPEILATLDDINAVLPTVDAQGPVIEADDENIDLIQVSVARVVRGYLSGVIDNATLMGWDSPENTPDIIKEIASMLIAAQLYFNYAARTSLSIEDDNFYQRLYDKAIGLLQRIIDGLILLEEAPVVSSEAMDPSDFHPSDDTDRAFTLSMEL
jgi:hypothetical protein